MVRVDVADPLGCGVTDVGFKAHVAPDGQPLTVNATARLNPDSELTVMVELAAPTCAMVTDEGLAESEKSGVDDPQPLNLNDPIRVLQLNAPSDFRYSLMYQKVQSSDGSIRSEL